MSCHEGMHWFQLGYLWGPVNHIKTFQILNMLRSKINVVTLKEDHILIVNT